MKRPEKQQDSRQRALLSAILLCLGLLIFLPTLGITKIIDPSDGFFAETAREMLESGKFVAPTLNYQAWNDKPILNHWLVALSYALFGVSEYASRLPAALCAIALCITTFIFSSRFLGRKTAFYAALMLLSSYLFQILGRVSLTDMPLALFVNLGLFSLFSGLVTNNRRETWVGWGALGLAFLTKGPISILIVIGVFSLYFLATTPNVSVRELITQFKKMNVSKGLLLVLAIAAPWFIVAGIVSNGRVLYDFFIVQNVQRASGTLVLNHEQPFWFYLPLLALAVFPFTALAPASVPVVRKWWQKRHCGSLRIKFLLFCGAFCITILGGFSLLKGKLPTYILPLVPSLCLILTAGINEALRAKQRLATMIGGATAAVASITAIFVFPKSIEATGSALLLAQGLMIAYIGTSLAFIVAALSKHRAFALSQMITVCVLVTAILIPFVFVEFYELHQLDYANILQSGMSKKGTLSQVGDTSPSAPFYAHKEIPRIRTFFDLAATTAYKGDHYVIAKSEYADFLSHAPIRKLIDKRGEWTLYQIGDPDQTLLNAYYTLERVKAQSRR